MSSRRATLDEFSSEPTEDDDEPEPEAEPAWTPGKHDGNCDNCGAHVDPGVVRVVGQDGSVPVCHRCYDPEGGSPFRGPATAVRHYREHETDRGATDAVRSGRAWE